MVREAKPVKLFQFFERHHVKIINPYKGIYYVLNREKHRWLRALSGKLEEQDLKELLTSISSLYGRLEREYADSIPEVALKANRKLAEQLRSDENMSKTLMEIMEPVLMEIRQECLKQGEEQGMKNGMVYAYYEMSLPTNEIAKKMQLTEKEVLEILNKKEEAQDI